MKVCIAEKPSVAKEIAEVIGAKTRRNGYFEGNGYAVTWTFGHLCCLQEPGDYTPKWKPWDLSVLPMIPSSFRIKLIDDEGIRKQFGIVEQLFSRAEEIINCGDAGQEGELIQRWVMIKARAKAPVKRLWISSLTEEAIRDGFAHLMDAADFDSLYAAGSARAIGDWLLGMNATRAYTLRYGNGRNVLSIGRVQTPTLALIVERQKAIENFRPEKYWEVRANYRGGWFSYATGDVDYSNVKGSADLTRYEAALYGTYLSGNHYLDLVGRFGRVANEFDVTSNSGALRTTGDYDQDYAAISAEYGYTLRDAATGFFLEPQIQIQAAYLRDFDYSTERGMRVYADDETSVIGRTGFRFGRQFRSNESTGEAYLRGDVLHQFTDGQSATLKADADRISTTWGDKDTWANFGVGAFWNWKDRFSLQLDLERTVGGETVDTWLMSGHARYYF